MAEDLQWCVKFYEDCFPLGMVGPTNIDPSWLLSKTRGDFSGILLNLNKLEPLR